MPPLRVPIATCLAVHEHARFRHGPVSATAAIHRTTKATTPALQGVKKSLFDQFMAILDDSSATVDNKAKEATKFITSHFVADLAQHSFLGAISVFSHGATMDARPWIMLFNNLTHRPKTTDDGTFLAAPSWQLEVSNDVSITMLGTKDAPQETLVGRHVKTQSVDRSGAQQILNLVASPFRVGIIFGTSGTGKTTNGILTAERSVGGRSGGVKAACARFTPEHFDTRLKAIEKLGKSEERRDAAVKQCVMDLVAEAIPKAYRSAPKPVKGVITRFVLFFDEMGSYPRFVRSLCAVSSVLNSTIRNDFVGNSTQVVILAGGTGVEGTNHAAGSEPSTYVMCDCTTDVWKALTSSWKGDWKILKDLIDGRESRAASLAADVVRNARAAAAFCEKVGDETLSKNPLIVTDAFIKSVTRETCAVYMSLNSLCELSWEEYLRVICQAIAAQHATVLNDTDFENLAQEFGVLTDNAVRAKTRSRAAKGRSTVAGTYDPKTETHMWVPKKTPRYTMDAAQAAMMLSMFDLGDRASTGEGFEEAGMDYTAICALVAYATALPSWRSGPLATVAHPQLPTPWRRPIAVAQYLQTVVRCSPPPSLVIKTLPHLVAVTTAQNEVAAHFGGADGMSPGRFWLNARAARGPDGFCFVDDRVLLMQFKFQSIRNKVPMTEWDVFAELHKMGMRTDECIVAAWLAALQDSKEVLPLKKLAPKTAAKRFEELRTNRQTWTSAASSVYNDGIRQLLLNGAYLATFRQICRGAKPAVTLKSFADELRKRPTLCQPAPFLEIFKKQKLTPTFVVMHCGCTPLAVPQNFGGHDVLLVTAPPNRPNELTMLDDYFPINFVHSEKYINLPVPQAP